jgi:threonine dehydrogenase-like Zn-dependent dehydrogenase
MKALYYPAWRSLEVKDIPKPLLGNGEVLVRVSACGVCGWELETFRSESTRRMPPLIMGHEFCGYTEERCGSQSNWIEGSRVISHALIQCGICSACIRGDTNLCVRREVFGMHRSGGFAEYVAVPKQTLISWPADISATTAVFAELLANGINAMRQGSMARRSRVVVIGAGPIGLMCIFAAKRLHRSSIIACDLIPERLGVPGGHQDLTGAIRKHWTGEHAEFVIDAVGSLGE